MRAPSAVSYTLLYESGEVLGRSQDFHISIISQHSARVKGLLVKVDPLCHYHVGNFVSSCFWLLRLSVPIFPWLETRLSLNDYIGCRTICLKAALNCWLENIKSNEQEQSQSFGSRGRDWTSVQVQYLTFQLLRTMCALIHCTFVSLLVMELRALSTSINRFVVYQNILWSEMESLGENIAF